MKVGSGCRAPHAALARDLPLSESIFSLPGDASAIFDGFNRKVPEAEIVIRISHVARAAILHFVFACLMRRFAAASHSVRRLKAVQMIPRLIHA